MECCYDYMIVPTKEGVTVFVIGLTDLRINSPVLLYDGGNHAVLFADEKKCDEAYRLQLMGREFDLAKTEAILVDYINEQTIKSLKNCTWCVFMEKNNLEDEDAVRDYKVVIRHVSKNSMTDNI